MSIVRQQEKTPERLSELLAILRGQGFGQASLGALFGQYMSLPGLVGFWPGHFGNGTNLGFLRDIGGQDLHLTRNAAAGFPLTSVLANGAMYINFADGGDYVSHADHTLFDIIGTEGQYISARRGLTMGAWVYFDDAASTEEYFMAKWGGAADLSYQIRRTSGGLIRFGITSDGSTGVAQSSTSSVGQAQWAFACGTFEPSTEVSVFLNGDKDSNTTSIPASIFNSSAAFEIGGRNGGNDGIDGRVALPFLTATHLTDEVILNLFESSRPYFGV